MYRAGLVEFLEKFEIYFPANHQEYAQRERKRERDRIFEAGENSSLTISEGEGVGRGVEKR